MNQLWIDKYKPKTMEEIYGNKKILETLNNYVSNLKDNPKLQKNILISGPCGIGKTTIANILFNKHNYRVIEYNSNNIEGAKTIKNVIQKSLYHGNVLEMFNQDNRTTGIIIDEFDSLISLGPKGGLSELMSILQKSSKSKNKKDKISVPIIFTSKLTPDKKLTELRKYVKEFKLKSPTQFEIGKLIQNIVQKENIKIDLDALNIYIKHQGGDIRNNINNLCYLCSNKTHITLENINNYIDSSTNKDNDYQLYDGIQKTFLGNKISYFDLENIYHMDTFFVPLLLYENYLKVIFSKKCSQEERIKLLKCISDYNGMHDILHDLIFKNNYWELLSYMPYITTAVINLELKKYKLLDTELKLNYRTIFTNISQYNIKYRKYVNLVLHTNNNIIRIKDIDFLLEIIFYYVKNKKKKNCLIKILQFYNINYEYFIDIIRLNKDLVTLLYKEDKQEFMELLKV
jgi:DNA polymerase III delta prime subunit